MTQRVVVTGVAGLTSLGDTWARVREGLATGRSGVVYMTDWDAYEDLHTRLGAPVSDFVAPPHFGRKTRRSMGRVAVMAVASAERAVANAGLTGAPVLADGRTGVAYGSSTGSTDAVREFGTMLMNHNLQSINSTTYLRMMAHTAAVNIAIYFGAKGRVVTTSSACTSGSQGIGYGYEAIKFDRQDVMLAGGAEELCPTEAAVFDTLFATSTKNAAPTTTPRPFDVGRDGLVVGEGACTLVLAEMVLAGSINKELVAWIERAGGRAAGISGKDAGLVRARKVERTTRDPGSAIEQVVDLGFVGEPESVDTMIIHTLLAAGIVPVIAPVAVGADGHTYVHRQEKPANGTSYKRLERRWKRSQSTFACIDLHSWICA